MTYTHRHILRTYIHTVLRERVVWAMVWAVAANYYNDDGAAIITNDEQWWFFPRWLSPSSLWSIMGEDWGGCMLILSSGATTGRRRVDLISCSHLWAWSSLGHLPVIMCPFFLGSLFMKAKVHTTRRVELNLMQESRYTDPTTQTVSCLSARRTTTKGCSKDMAVV